MSKHYIFDISLYQKDNNHWKYLTNLEVEQQFKNFLKQYPFVVKLKEVKDE